MLTNVTHELWVADMEGCTHEDGKTPVLHCAKDPCHRQAVGYSTKEKLAPGHPEYLAARRGENHLYLNLIDPPLPLFKLESFQIALDFIDERMRRIGSVVVHCNSGLSRAPSIALLWLSKRMRRDPDETFAVARAAFERLLPSYAPGKGIEQFLTEQWGRIQ